MHTGSNTNQTSSIVLKAVYDRLCQLSALSQAMKTQPTSGRMNGLCLCAALCGSFILNDAQGLKGMKSPLPVREKIRNESRHPLFFVCVLSCACCGVAVRLFNIIALWDKLWFVLNALCGLAYKMLLC